MGRWRSREKGVPQVWESMEEESGRDPVEVPPVETHRQDGRAPDPLVGPMALGGALLFPVAVLALWRWSSLGVANALFLCILLELLPVLAVAQLRLVGKGQLPRIPVYLASALTIVILGAISLLLGGRLLGWAQMGLGWEPGGRALAWALGVTTCALLLQGLFHKGRRLLGVRESPILVQLLPQTLEEKGVFILLSGAAGLGEELAYRAYVIPVLALLLGSGWGAAAVSSLAFGVLHAYQGWMGILRTAALGFLLAASFLLSGSLWPAVLAHTILDLLGGLVLGEALVRE